MTKNEIITVAKCCIVDNCGPCPLMGTDNCITGFMNHILEYMKNEPAPAATGTSSTKKENTFQVDDSTKEKICQAYDTVDEACADIIDIYEVMSEREHRAFNIGEAYGKICSTKCKLEGLIGASGREGE